MAGREPPGPCPHAGQGYPAEVAPSAARRPRNTPRPQARKPQRVGALRPYAHAPEKNGAKPPPGRRNQRSTGRGREPAPPPISRRARLGAPQNGAGKRATGTPGEGQGPTTHAGRPAAPRRTARPTPAHLRGLPGPRFSGGPRTGAAQARTGAGRTPTKQPHQQPPPRGQRRAGTRRDNSHQGRRGRAGQSRPECAGRAAYLLSSAHRPRSGAEHGTSGPARPGGPHGAGGHGGAAKPPLRRTGRTPSEQLRIVLPQLQKLANDAIWCRPPSDAGIYEPFVLVPRQL